MSNNIINDLNNEIWKDVPEYSGFYQVSNYGRIKAFKSLRCKNSNGNHIRIINPYMDKKSGFLRFKATKNNKNKSIILHSLIAKLFIPNPKNMIFVCHKNGDRRNNKVENLEWRGKKKEIFEIIDGEIWKDVKDFEGLYKVSNYGRVYSVERKNTDTQRRGSYQTGRIMCQRTNNGYKTIKLLKNGIEKAIRVHRLVAEHFIINPENKPFVNHKDLNRSNNHVDNLEWVTPQENTMHSTKNNSKISIYRKDISFTIGDILKIKKLVRKQNFSYNKVAKLYNTTADIIKYIER